MNISVNWLAFVEVLVAAMAASVVIVVCYAVGLRLLVAAGRVPVVSPQEFTDAITIISAKEAARAAKAAAKAARKNPLTERQQRIALVGAIACFAVCALAVLGGIALLLLGR